ncbi:MAG: hypothetical protein ACR2N0_14185 [Rubrobacteraceae bacterium]|jgi:hypothetical protein|nr:hypothetical protein [Rubrobacter sp.]
MKHGLVTRRVADAIAEGRRVWVYVNPPGSEREGRVEVVGYSVEIGFWVKIVLADDNLLFNGFTLMRTNFRDEAWDFMAKIGRVR